MIGDILLGAVKIWVFWLDTKGATKEEKKEFFAWIKDAGNNHNSAKFMEYSDQQMKWREQNEWKEST